jgi:hypothetical protein
VIDRQGLGIRSGARLPRDEASVQHDKQPISSDEPCLSSVIRPPERILRFFQIGQTGGRAKTGIEVQGTWIHKPLTSVAQTSQLCGAYMHHE